MAVDTTVPVRGRPSAAASVAGNVTVAEGGGSDGPVSFEKSRWTDAARLIQEEMGRPDDGGGAAQYLGGPGRASCDATTATRWARDRLVVASILWGWRGWMIILSDIVWKIVTKEDAVNRDSWAATVNARLDP